MGLWTEYKKKTNVESSDTFLIYDAQNGVRQVTGNDVKISFRDIPDTTLQKEDTPADSKTVGAKIDEIKKQTTTQGETLTNKADGKGIEFFYDESKGCMAARINS